MSIYTIRTGATAMVESAFLSLATKLIRGSGVMDIYSASGDFSVSAGSGLAVNIAAGTAFLTATSGSTYPVIMDATQSNLAITSNSSGNPRISSIVLYANLATSANTAATNVCSIVSVDGTPAGSPTAPSSATIQSAIGASNPYTILANVTVNSGSSVPNTITDTRTTPLLRPTVPNVLTDTYASTTTFDVSTYNVHNLVLTGSPTLAVSNVTLNQPFFIRLIQDGSGNHTVTWFTTIKWGNGGSAPVLSTGGNKSDLFCFIMTSAGNYEGHVVDQAI